jgi:hypothetical protein
MRRFGARVFVAIVVRSCTDPGFATRTLIAPEERVETGVQPP